MGAPIKDKKFFTQAKTYEDFIKKIKKETDLSKLRQLRYKVIAEIMQAMTVENLKQEEDFDGLLSQINSKSYRLSTRNLARYINQCKVAKSMCEKRIYDMSRAQKSAPHYADMKFKETETKLLELDDILRSPYVLPFFVQFLEKQKDYGPLKLWLLIEQCRTMEKRPKDMYTLIKQGYMDHLTVTSPLRAHQVSRHLIRMAEAYVEHKSGYWQFIYEIQEELYTMLMEQHYKPFLVSSQYMQYVCTTEGRRSTLQTSMPSSDNRDSVEFDSTVSDEYMKINSLREELKSKEVLLETLDIMNYCSAEELAQLEEEIQNLKVTINQLQHHNERTTIWWKFLGTWEASVEDVEGSDFPQETLYTVIIKQTKPVCHQILPFNNKSKFKLTQYNLNPTAKENAGVRCMYADADRSQPDQACSYSSCSKPQGEITKCDPMETGGDAIKPLEPGQYPIRGGRAESNVSYESLVAESSYRSVRPDSILLSHASRDTITVDEEDGTIADNVSRTSVQSISSQSLILPPEPHDTITPMIHEQNQPVVDEPVLQPSIGNEMAGHDLESLMDQHIEVGNSLFYRNDSIQVGNSLFYRRSSSPSSLADIQSTSTLSPSTSLQDLTMSLSIQPSDSVSMVHQSAPTEPPSLSLPIPYSPDNRTSPDFYRESPPPLNSDEDTISCTSGDLPLCFMSDDVFFYQQPECEQIMPSEESPSLKMKRFLSNYTEDDLETLPHTDNDSFITRTHSFLESESNTLMSCATINSHETYLQSFADQSDLTLFPNQSDDEKIRNLHRSSEAANVSHNTSISLEEEALSDSSLENTDPYLVIDIQSLPSEFAAPELLDYANKQDSVELDGGYEAECEEVHTGWVITHTWEEIKGLYMALRGCKSAGYPSSFPIPLPRDSSQLRESMEHTGDFLNFVLRDKILSQSEHVYRFFNPTCEQLYRNTQCKQNGAEQMEDKNKDSIAIPFYTLLGEIFEIHGHLQWLRRQIMYLVRITFGSTIERQIYRAMSWAGSEQQVFWYIQTFKTCMWGDVVPCPELTDPVMREHMRGKVRISLLNTPPHILNVLFGANKTRKGLAKLLDTMEQRCHTKHCFYTIIELLLLHLIGTDSERNKRIKLSMSNKR